MEQSSKQDSIEMQKAPENTEAGDDAPGKAQVLSVTSPGNHKRTPSVKFSEQPTSVLASVTNEFAGGELGEPAMNLLRQKSVMSSPAHARTFSRKEYTTHGVHVQSNPKESVEEQLKGLDTLVILAALLAGLGVESLGAFSRDSQEDWEEDDIPLHLAFAILFTGTIIEIAVAMLATMHSVNIRTCLRKSVTAAKWTIQDLKSDHRLAQLLGSLGAACIMIGLGLTSWAINTNYIVLSWNNFIIILLLIWLYHSYSKIKARMEEYTNEEKASYLNVKFQAVPESQVMLVLKGTGQDDLPDNFPEDSNCYHVFRKDFAPYVKVIDNVLLADDDHRVLFLPEIVRPDWLNIPKCKEYIQHHFRRGRSIFPTDEDGELKNMLGEWDYEWIRHWEFDVFFPVLETALFLEIEDLLEVLSRLFQARCHNLSMDGIHEVIQNQEWKKREACDTPPDEATNLVKSWFLGAGVKDDPEEEMFFLASADEMCGFDFDIVKTLYNDAGFKDVNIEDHAKDWWLTTVENTKLRNFALTKGQLSLCSGIFSDKEIEGVTMKDNVVYLEKANYETLQLLWKYLDHHSGKEPAEIAKPIRSVKMEKIVEDTWDATFINSMSKKQLFQVILCANIIQCRPLLFLGCAKVATMIKGKSPEEIKQILGEES